MAAIANEGPGPGPAISLKPAAARLPEVRTMFKGAQLVPPTVAVRAAPPPLRDQVLKALQLAEPSELDLVPLQVKFGLPHRSCRLYHASDDPGLTLSFQAQWLARHGRPTGSGPV